MILFKKIISVFFKIFLLLIVVTFEKVVGLPIVFMTLFLVIFVNEQDFYKYIFLVASSLFLALTYSFSFSLSLLLLVYLVLATNYGDSIITNDINRVLFLIYSSIAVVAVASGVFWGRGVVSYFIISSLIMIIVLMKTLFSRYGLTGKITGKRSNFFR